MSNALAQRQTTLTRTTLVVFALVFVAPLIVAVMTSVKSPSELTRVLSLPSEFYWQNYTAAFSRMGRSFFNSVAITVPAVVLSILIGAVAGYPLAYMERRGPTVMLRDPVSGRSQPQRISLANRALRSVFTAIAPGQSIALDDVLKASQLRQFGEKIDLTAEIGVSTTITVGTAGATQPFEGKVTLRIAGRDVPPKK